MADKNAREFSSLFSTHLHSFFFSLRRNSLFETETGNQTCRKRDSNGKANRKTRGARIIAREHFRVVLRKENRRETKAVLELHLQLVEHRIGPEAYPCYFHFSRSPFRVHSTYIPAHFFNYALLLLTLLLTG